MLTKYMYTAVELWNGTWKSQYTLMNVGHNAKPLCALLSELSYWSDLESVPHSVLSPKPLSEEIGRNGNWQKCHLRQGVLDSPFGARKAQQGQLLVWASPANISASARVYGSMFHALIVCLCEKHFDVPGGGVKEWISSEALSCRRNGKLSLANYSLGHFFL